MPTRDEVQALSIGTPVIKTSGYDFPGEIRAAFTTKAGALRYVVECTVPEVAGMLHIFSPAQIAPTMTQNELTAALGTLAQMQEGE